MSFPRIIIPLHRKELFDSTAPQIAEIRTVAKSLPLILKYSAKSLFLNRLCQTDENLKYAANYNTHLDFLIINRIGKQPVLAIETDGYSYHNEKTIQHHRDIMKDHILSKYGLHLLRLSTKGSGEREKIVTALNKIDNIQSSKRC